MRVRLESLGLMCLALAAPAAGQDAPRWAMTAYLQEAFPKQTRTNQQIGEINQAFGVDFEDWDDVHNVSLGVKLFRCVTPRWLVGLEVDWSAGAIDGGATIPTEAGPATLDFEQRYNIFADLMAAAHWLPCENCRRARPFVLLAAGLAYEEDSTTLTLRNDYLDEELRVDNHGWFPVATAGLGLEVPFGRERAWYVELGGAYFWGRLKHHVPARGSLAPAPEVLADTDSTGPNYWLGVGRRY